MSNLCLQRSLKDPHQYYVGLTLEDGTRQIGIIDTDTNTFYTVRAHHHLFKKTNSLGINYELLKDNETYPFHWIDIDYQGERKHLITSRDFMLHNGKIMNFKKAGFEVQMFLVLDKFGKDKVLKWLEKESKKRQRASQGELF